MKYNNRKTVIDGITFDSAAEADYYCQLKLLMAGGVVKDFTRQTVIEILPPTLCEKVRDGKRLVYRPGKKNKESHVKYIADFVVEYADGHTEVVDVKGVKTDVYNLKRKMLLAKWARENKNYTFVEVNV